jgi:hypothetical protein
MTTEKFLKEYFISNNAPVFKSNKGCNHYKKVVYVRCVPVGKNTKFEMACVDCNEDICFDMGISNGLIADMIKKKVVITISARMNHKTGEFLLSDEELTKRCQCLFKESVGKMRHRDYIRSDNWLAKRQERLYLDGNACRECGSDSNLNVHHLVYPNNYEYGNEKMSDLITLCEICHRKSHNIKI